MIRPSSRFLTLAALLASAPLRADVLADIEQATAATAAKVSPFDLPKTYAAWLDQFGDLLAVSSAPDRHAPLLALQKLSLHTTRPGADAERKEWSLALCARLTPGSKEGRNLKPQARAAFARQLEWVGAEEALATLGQLLSGEDAEVAEIARAALEQNPAPRANDVLRNAAPKLKEPALRAGVIAALGRRRDAASLTLLQQGLGDRDALVSTAAAAALVDLGSVEAAATLARSLGGAPEPTRGRRFAALVATGFRLTDAGQTQPATRLFEKLATLAQTPREKATVLTARLRLAPDPLPLIGEALHAPESAVQSAALTSLLARHEDARGRMIDFAAASLPSELKVQAITQMAAAKYPETEPLALDWIKVGEPFVQAAAVSALAVVGTGRALEPLLLRVQSKSPEEKSAALRAIASLSGTEIDATLAKLANDGPDAARVAAVTALAQRAPADVATQLLAIGKSGPPGVTKAAFEALGRTATDDLAPVLVAELAAAAGPRLDGLGSALRALAARSPRPEALLPTLAGGLEKAAPPVAVALLGAIATLPGEAALAPLVTATQSPDPTIRAAGVEALASSKEFVAAPTLLSLATDANAPLAQHSTAIRGVARLVSGTPDAPAAQRVQLAADALKAARRLEEKRLAVSALAAVNDKAVVPPLLAALGDAELKPDAAISALAAAEKLAKNHQSAAQELAKKLVELNVTPDLTKRAEAIVAAPK